MGVSLWSRSERILRSEGINYVTESMMDEESEFDSKLRSEVYICGENPRWCNSKSLLI